MFLTLLKWKLEKFETIEEKRAYLVKNVSEAIEIFLMVFAAVLFKVVFM